MEERKEKKEKGDGWMGGWMMDGDGRGEDIDV
jgi:hypothetical protein